LRYNALRNPASFAERWYEITPSVFVPNLESGGAARQPVLMTFYPRLICQECAPKKSCEFRYIEALQPASTRFVETRNLVAKRKRMPSEIRVKNRLQTWVRFRLIRTVPNRVSSCWRAGQAWNDPVTTALTDPTADDVDAGNVIPNAGPTFTIKANRSWTLKIKSQNATNWTYSGSFVGVKPIGDPAWSTALVEPSPRSRTPTRRLRLVPARATAPRRRCSSERAGPRTARAQAIFLVPTACRSCSL
jgi:hypothetical protein